MSLHFIQKRIARKPKHTISNLYVDGKFICNILEDRDRGLDDSMTVEEIKSIKVYGETAIPTGTYEIILTVSPKFKKRSWARPYSGKVPRLVDVKGFEGVLIHPFNTPEESLGCLGPGENRVVGKVLNSTANFNRIMNDFILPAVEKGEKIYITIE